jgi:hypothetical protein
MPEDKHVAVNTFVNVGDVEANRTFTEASIDFVEQGRLVHARAL